MQLKTYISGEDVKIVTIRKICKQFKGSEMRANICLLK
jgi:hypothetical protein